MGTASVSPSRLSPIVNAPAGMSAMPAGGLVLYKRKNLAGKALLTVMVTVKNDQPPVWRGQVGGALQNVICKRSRPKENSLIARRRNAQISQLRQSGIDADKQGQHEEQKAGFGSHNKFGL